MIAPPSRTTLPSSQRVFHSSRFPCLFIIYLSIQYPVSIQQLTSIQLNIYLSSITSVQELLSFQLSLHSAILAVASSRLWELLKEPPLRWWILQNILECVPQRCFNKRARFKQCALSLGLKFLGNCCWWKLLNLEKEQNHALSPTRLMKC